MADEKPKKLNIFQRDYIVTAINGSFGTYGIISVGDVLHFHPDSALRMKDGETLKFTSKSENKGYLVMNDLRLESIRRHKGKITAYSFVSRHGARGNLSTKLRFDLHLNSHIFIVYESDGIIQGTINLRIKPKGEQDADGNPLPNRVNLRL